MVLRIAQAVGLPGTNEQLEMFARTVEYMDTLDGTRTGEGTKASQKPVLFIHPDTFFMDSAHVGAWKPGHELQGYIPLYTNPAPEAVEQLVEAAESARDWMDSQARSQSKGGHHSFDLMMLRDRKYALDLALAAVKTES